MMPRIGILLLAAGLAVSAACLSGPTSAQERLTPVGGKVPVAGAASLRAEYAALPAGDTLTSKGETYVALPDVRAMPSSTGAAPAGLAVIERKGRFLVYKETRPGMKSLRIATARDESAGPLQVSTYAVVRNSRTGGAGIVLGTIVVKPRDMTQADALAAATGLTLTARYDHLGIVFYKAAPNQDIAAATAALRADARVISADPEILEHPHEPK